MRYKPFARASVEVVKGSVVLTLSRPRARHLASVIDRTRPREPWLQEAVASMQTAADPAGDRSEELYRRVDWLDASARVSQQLLRPSSSRMIVVQQIADHVLRLSDAHSLTIVVAAPDDPELVEVRFAAGQGAAELIGRTGAKRPSLAGSAMDHDESRLANAADPSGSDAPVGSASRSRPVMAVPIRSGDGHPLGALVLYRRFGQAPFDGTDLSMAEDFARQTSLALELAESRTRRGSPLERSQHEQFTQRLHDDLLQRLFSIGMTVQSAEADLRQGEDVPSVRRAEAHLARAVDELNATIRDVRASLQSRSIREPAADPRAVGGAVVSVQQEAAASLVHEAAVHAAELAEVAVVTAADRAAEAEAASAARAQRSAAVERAAATVAARVIKAAAAVESEADLAALTVAQAAFDAAYLIGSKVAPGSERDAALTATLVATAVSAIAIKTAAVTAAARAEVARDAAAAAEAAAVAAADAEKIVDLEVMCAAVAVQTVATRAALVLAERTDAEATAFAETHH